MQVFKNLVKIGWIKIYILNYICNSFSILHTKQEGVPIIRIKGSEIKRSLNNIIF